jgi:hypothetical protein
MNHFGHYRTLAQVFAPLRERRGEGATASDLRQDKRDSLRHCPAVVLSLLDSMFAKAANSPRSLAILTCHCTITPICTSSAFAHVR